jgi:hypothetical protein
MLSLKKTRQIFVLIVPWKNYMKHSKTKYPHTPGYAVWKFVLGTKFVYRARNHDALKLYWQIRDRKSFDVYVRTTNGWEFVTTNIPSETCNCGRRYDQTPTGESFKFQEHPLVYSIEAMRATISSPTLCMICYYKGELNKGRWAPKYVKKEIGLET